MEFDINNPPKWIEHQVALDLNRTVLNCCASIFEEEILVRLAARPLLVYPAMQTKHMQHIRMLRPGEAGYDPNLLPEDNTDPVQYMKVSGDVPQDCVFRRYSDTDSDLIRTGFRPMSDSVPEFAGQRSGGIRTAIRDGPDSVPVHPDNVPGHPDSFCHRPEWGGGKGS